MTVATALSRVAEIETALLPPAPPKGTEGVAGSKFAQALGKAGVAAATPVSPGALGAVEAARGEVGQAEQPPGSNDSARIAEYRSAVAGAEVGPWCADFVSWLARQSGVPLGDNGEGFQSVESIWNWAEGAGRAVSPADGPPQPGDLILWGNDHVGIVEAVDGDGTIHTIEGNSSDQVAERTYGSDGGGATGYVRLG